MINKLNEYIALIVLSILVIALAILIVKFIVDFKLDYRCTNMPYSDFLKDTRCQEYWSMRHE